jgi:hypothetical protein
VATYQEFCGNAGRFGGTQVSEDVWRFDLQGKGDGRNQKVFVFHEVMPPDLEFLQVKSAFAMIGSVDCTEVIKNYGDLNIGAIGYNPNFDEQGNPRDGFLTISSSFPLPVLDLSQPSWFFLYLNLIARASDSLEQQFMGRAGLPDSF